LVVAVAGTFFAPFFVIFVAKSVSVAVYRLQQSNHPTGKKTNES